MEEYCGQHLVVMPFCSIRHLQRSTAMSDIETLNPFAAASYEHVCESPAGVAARVDAWYVEISSRQRWLLTTVLGTAVGGGLFYPPGFFIGAPYAAAVALPIAAAMSCLTRFGNAGTGSGTQRAVYSLVSGAVTGLLCVFLCFGWGSSADTLTLIWPYSVAVLLGGTCAGISSLLFSSRFRLKKLAAPSYEPVDFPEAMTTR